LPAERRAAFVLTQVLGLSYAEAAAVEDIPVGTIRSWVARPALISSWLCAPLR
jgi:RNA polymerase sigma-70 factor (ECF subfamily)